MRQLLGASERGRFAMLTQIPPPPAPPTLKQTTDTNSSTIRPTPRQNQRTRLRLKSKDHPENSHSFVFTDAYQSCRWPPMDENSTITMEGIAHWPCLGRTKRQRETDGCRRPSYHLSRTACALAVATRICFYTTSNKHDDDDCECFCRRRQGDECEDDKAFSGTCFGPN